MPGIGKDTQITGGDGPRYKYRSIDDIMPLVKTAFARNGVFITPTFKIMVDDTVEVGKGRAIWSRVILEGTFRFTATDGSYVEAVTIGEARDGSDKAMNKAMTAAYKYALAQTLAIADVQDDSDHESPPPARASIANFARLKALGPDLEAAGLTSPVKEWAETHGVDLRAGVDDAALAEVIEFATGLLAIAADE